MNVAIIDVKEDGRYSDGTGRSKEFKKGKHEVNPDMAQRLAEANPDKIQVVGSEAKKSAQPAQDEEELFS